MTLLTLFLSSDSHLSLEKHINFTYFHFSIPILILFCTLVSELMKRKIMNMNEANCFFFSFISLISKLKSRVSTCDIVFFTFFLLMSEFFWFNCTLINCFPSFGNLDCKLNWNSQMHNSTSINSEIGAC